MPKLVLAMALYHSNREVKWGALLRSFLPLNCKDSITQFAPCCPKAKDSTGGGGGQSVIARHPCQKPVLTARACVPGLRAGTGRSSQSLQASLAKTDFGFSERPYLKGLNQSERGIHPMLSPVCASHPCLYAHTHTHTQHVCMHV